VGRPEVSERKDIPFPQEHQRAIIIAPVRAVSKLVRTLPVQMLCPGKPGAAWGRNP